MPLFKKSPKIEGSQERHVEEAACPHTSLVPRWENAADIGDLQRATSFRCDACGSEFNAERARMLRATEARRVARTVRG